MNKNIKLASICLMLLGVSLILGCGTGGLRGADAEVDADIERCAQYGGTSSWNQTLVSQQSILCEEAGCYWQPYFYYPGGTGACISLYDSCDKFVQYWRLRFGDSLTPEEACQKSKSNCEVLKISGAYSQCLEAGTLHQSSDRPDEATCDQFSSGYLASLDPVGCYNAGCIPSESTLFSKCYSYHTPCDDVDYAACPKLPNCRRPDDREYARTGERCLNKAG